MRTAKEARKVSGLLFRNSFTEGKLDKEKISHMVETLLAEKPRHCVDALKDYQRLIRLETEKRHAVIESATHWGIPLSTTHVITTAILGVGATKRLNAVKWPVMINIVFAWVLTLPVTALIAYLITIVAHWMGAK